MRNPVDVPISPYLELCMVHVHLICVTQIIDTPGK